MRVLSDADRKRKDLKIMRVLSDADRKRKDSLACQNELLEMPFNFENRFCQIHPKTAKKLTILISIEFFRLSAGN